MKSAPTRVANCRRSPSTVSPAASTGPGRPRGRVVDDRGQRGHPQDRSTTPRPDCATCAVARPAGVGEVAIERGDGPVVDALLAAELTVVVITPNQLKNLRCRYGSAGNKDDRFDAYVLADTLRTDRARLHPADPRHPGHHRAAHHRAVPGATWSSTASPPPTSSAHTCRSCSPAPWACSPRLDSGRSA